MIDAAARSGTVLEINSQPDRLDLTDTDARLARDRGVLLAIDSDAHRKDQYSLMAYGIATARRAWLSPAHVANAMPLPDLLTWLKRHDKA